MSADFDPLPDERGDLQPPRRRPPTAVGTMTPPPPSGEPPRRRRHLSPRRLAVAVLVFISPLLLGALSAVLIRNADDRWASAAGWLLAGVAAVLAGTLLWYAAILPLRDHFRTRAADRLSHAR